MPLFIASGWLQRAKSKLNWCKVSQQITNGGKVENTFWGKTSALWRKTRGLLLPSSWTLFLAVLSTQVHRLGAGDRRGRVAPVAPGKPGPRHTVTWGHWRNATATSPSLGGMRKCEHNDFLTDLFYYERKIWDSSSLIMMLTSDNSTPLLFNGNITHAILKMEKHFHVLFKSEMIYGIEQTLWCPARQWDANEIQFQRVWGGATDFFFSFLILKGAMSSDLQKKSSQDMSLDLPCTRGLVTRQAFFWQWYRHLTCTKYLLSAAALFSFRMLRAWNEATGNETSNKEQVAEEQKTGGLTSGLGRK